VASIDLAEIIRRALLSAIGDVLTSEVAKVIAYDGSTGRAKVQEQVQLPVLDADGDIGNHEIPPIYEDVPVLFLRGYTDAHAITFPLRPGDHGLLLFTSRDSGSWRATGSLALPGSARMHGATAWFLPGVVPDATVLPAQAVNALVVASPDLRLGDHTASLAVAKCPPADVTWDTWFVNVTGALQAISTQLITLGQPGVPTPQLTALIATVPALCTKVKGQ